MLFHKLQQLKDIPIFAEIMTIFRQFLNLPNSLAKKFHYLQLVWTFLFPKK